jgi:hypothetical protein
MPLAQGALQWFHITRTSTIGDNLYLVRVGKQHWVSAAANVFCSVWDICRDLKCLKHLTDLEDITLLQHGAKVACKPSATACMTLHCAVRVGCESFHVEKDLFA